jgi:hypothetical protein
METIAAAIIVAIITVIVMKLIEREKEYSVSFILPFFEGDEDKAKETFDKLAGLKIPDKYIKVKKVVTGTEFTFTVKK